MLNLHLGRNRCMLPELLKGVSAHPSYTKWIIVPKQLTLLTERTLLDRLHLNGSFELQVVSTARFCRRIFELYGTPSGARIDERGRAILVHHALQEVSDRLTLYKNAQSRLGFVQRAAKHLELIRQAGLTPSDLRAVCGESIPARMSRKLSDLATLQECYESLLGDNYLDSEGEFAAAIEHLKRGAFPEDTELWFYGYDMMPPMLCELIAAAAYACPETHVLLPLEPDVRQNDYDCFAPLSKLKERLLASPLVKAAGWAEHICETDSADAGRAPCIRELEYALFAQNAEPIRGTKGYIRPVCLRNIHEECRYTAARVQDLVRNNGWRYRDIAILCSNPEDYAAPLHTAFQAFDIPLVMTEKRNASRHAAAECLLTTLEVLDRGYLPEAMEVLMHTGLFGITEDECDRMTNYAISTGLRGDMWKHALRRGSERTDLEPVRARMSEPIEKLRARLKACRTLPEQLEALFDYLTGLNVYEQIQAHVQRLAENELWEAASEESQVWNRIIGSFDQLYALMGDEPLSLRKLYELLSESLEASVIAALPQMDDAVCVQGTTTVCPKPVKALLLIGMSDATVSDNSGLLTPEQRSILHRITRHYLGPEGTDLPMLNRFYIKSSIGMASDFVGASYPMTGSSGDGQQPGMLLNKLTALCPETPLLLPQSGDEIEKMMLAGVESAVSGVAGALSDERSTLSALHKSALASLQLRAAEDPAAAGGIARLRTALRRGSAVARQLSPETAHRLYGKLTKLSISRLEKFAECPYAHLLQYGISPVIIRPFEFTPINEGNFLHDCLRSFVHDVGSRLSDLPEADAKRIMGEVADRQHTAYLESTALGETETSRALYRELRETACNAAAALAVHFNGSRLRDVRAEISFGPEDGENAVKLLEDVDMEGRIDRVDVFDGCLRVVDYKRSEKSLDFKGMYNGTSLQLPIYLYAASRRYRTEGAGAFYLGLDDGIADVQSTNPDDVKEKRLKKIKMKGIIPNDPDIIAAMSPNVKGIISNQTVAETSSVVWGLLQRYAVHKAGELANEIRRGSCAPSPVQDGDSLACRHCDQRAACPFDKELNRSSIRKTGKEKPEQILEAMRQALGEAEA